MALLMRTAIQLVGGKMANRNDGWDDYLQDKLVDPETAAEYLTACLEEGPDVFLLAIRDVAKANGGMSKLADETDLAREALYRMFSESGNPTFASISAVMGSLGMSIRFAPKIEGSEAA